MINIDIEILFLFDRKYFCIFVCILIDRVFYGCLDILIIFYVNVFLIGIELFSILFKYKKVKFLF